MFRIYAFRKYDHQLTDEEMLKKLQLAAVRVIETTQNSRLYEEACRNLKGKPGEMFQNFDDSLQSAKVKLLERSESQSSSLSSTGKCD